MSGRDELARVLHGWGESHDWRSERCDEFCTAWFEAADAVLSEWLPTLADDEALMRQWHALSNAGDPDDPDPSWDWRRGSLKLQALALALALSPVSPAPVSTRAADEHDDRPGAPKPGRSASTT